MLNLKKFPAQVFCYREVQTVRSMFSDWLKTCAGFINTVTINSITFTKPSGRTTAPQSPPETALCRHLINNNSSSYIASDRTAPNFPISTYRNTKNEKSKNYFQPKTRCRCAGLQFNALKALKTLGFNTAPKTLCILPGGAV